MGVALKRGLAEKRDIIDELSRHDLPVIDLSENDMARLHIRHMVGGRADVENERILRFQFPERTGALLQFLRGMQSGWNISLFHYRNYGSEYGRVLMGIQVAESDDERFRQFLDSTGYAYTIEEDNPAYDMFLSLGGGR